MDSFFPRDAGSMDCIRILCHDWLLPLISESKLLHIRHDPVGFLKSDGPMKPLAVRFVQFAVAVEFRTAFGFCPVFAHGQQFAGDALPTRAFPDVDSFQIPHRAGFRALYIVMAELALGKTHGFTLLPVQKDRRILPHLFQWMIRPQLTGECSDIRGVGADSLAGIGYRHFFSDLEPFP